MVDLSSINDALSTVAGGVAKPLAAFGIGGQQGDGFSLSGMLDALGKAGTDIAYNSPLGLAGMAKQLPEVWGQTSPLEKGLAIGGLIGGVTGLASHLHAQSMAAPEPALVAPETVGMQVPRMAQYESELLHQEQMGLNRQTYRFKPEVEQLYPGIRREANWILGASDPAETVAGIAKWSTDDPLHLQKTSAAAGIVAELGNRIDQYAPDSDRLRFAQMYLAKSDYINDTGLLGSLSGDNKSLLPGTSDFKKLYTKFTKDPHLLKPEESDRLVNYMKDVGEATEHIQSPDFQFDPLVRLNSVEMDQGGPVFYFSRPQWDDSIFTPDSTERISRLKQLNHRPLYDRGVQHIRQLLAVAQMDADQRSIGSYGILPRPNELGANWYPDAQATIDSVRGDLSLDKATALVSLTSATQDWRANIDKAMEAAPYLKRADVNNPEFQSYLRNEPTKNAVQHQTTLAGIQQSFIDRGFEFDQPATKKILRLANESPEQIFATTTGRKQKNFYLNLLHPEYQLPVTIDRHAYDAFLGLDTGVDVRPVDMALEKGGEKIYDLIAQAYRQVAQERGMKSNEAQAVAWETWKQLKNEHNGIVGYKGLSWTKGDPFRLMGPNGEENMAFQAMRGMSDVSPEGVSKLVPTDRVPVVLASTRPDKARFGLQTTVDGSVAVLAPVTATTDGTFRNLYPEFADAGTARYVPGFARHVEDVEHLLGRLSTDDSRVVELYDNTMMPVHPATVPGTTAILEFPPDAYYRAQGQLPKDHQVLHGSVVEKPVLSRERLTSMDLEPKSFQDVEQSPLATHAWVGISANTGDHNPASHEALRQDIKKAGYDPIEQTGYYDGEEKSFLVFGMPPAEAAKLGAKYNQESVVTNSGLLYTTGDNAGQVVPAAGDIAFDQLTDNYYSEVQLGSQKVKYQLPLDFDSMGPADQHPDLWAERTTDKPAKVLLPFKPGTSRDEIVRTLENMRANGARNSVVYTHGYDLGGNYVPVRDHVYTDGFRTAVHRTITDDISSPNGFRTFMHSQDAAGLPRGLHEVDARVQTPALRPEPDGSFVVNGEVRARSNTDPLTTNKVGDFKVGNNIARFFSVEVDPKGMPIVTWGRNPEEVGGTVGELSGSKVKFDLGDSTDLMPAVQAMDTLRRIGINPRSFEIKANGDVIRSTPVTTTPKPEPVYRTVEIPGGYETFQQDPSLQTTERYAFRRSEDFFRVQSYLDEAEHGPKEQQLQQLILPHFAAMDQLAGRFGLQEFYIPLEAKDHIPGIVNSIDKFDREFPDAIREYAPKSVRFSDATGGNIAWINWGGRGWGSNERGIFFNRKILNVPRTYEGLASLMRATGYWANRGVDDSVAFTTTHELGHVLDAALRTRARELGQIGDITTFDRYLQRIVDSHANDIVAQRKALSAYGFTSTKELVAESYANATLSSTPTALAEDVTDKLLSLYDSMKKGHFG